MARDNWSYASGLAAMGTHVVPRAHSASIG